MSDAENNVRSLRGGALPIPQVDPEVVEDIEYLLQQARSGHIAGLCYATTSPEGHIETGWAGHTSSHSMVAAVAILQARMMRAKLDK